VILSLTSEIADGKKRDSCFPLSFYAESFLHSSPSEKMLIQEV
jgi:hypothetical protein